MNDGDSKNIQQIQGERKPNNVVQRHGTDVSSVLQSVWFRCRAVFPNITDRKFMESELRVVLSCGLIFWVLYLLYETTK